MYTGPPCQGGPDEFWGQASHDLDLRLSFQSLNYIRRYWSGGLACNSPSCRSQGGYQEGDALKFTVYDEDQSSKNDGKDDKNLLRKCSPPLYNSIPNLEPFLEGLHV